MTVADILFMTRERISSPEQYFGFKIGEDKKLVDWPDILLYFQNVASSSDRVLFKELGVSTEGNPFVLAIISSKTNLERLERIREVHLKIGNPVGVVNAEAEKLVNEGKAIVLITCSIHSTEVGGSQMSMELLHKLATDDTDEVNEILDNVVLLLIPSLNPDGNRLVCDWYRKYLGTQFEGTSPPMVYHKYAGHDNNRDWFMFSLKETKLAV
jgi:murein tripeptide amidase MpaA